MKKMKLITLVFISIIGCTDKDENNNTQPKQEEDAYFFKFNANGEKLKPYFGNCYKPSNLIMTYEDYYYSPYKVVNLSYNLTYRNYIANNYNCGKQNDTITYFKTEKELKEILIVPTCYTKIYNEDKFLLGTVYDAIFIRDKIYNTLFPNPKNPPKKKVLYTISLKNGVPYIYCQTEDFNKYY